MNEQNKQQNIEETNKDLLNIFDNFIKTGMVEDEKEVVPGFKIKVKVLNVQELLDAESIMGAEQAPADVVAKVRGASILSQAIIRLNGADIEKESLNKQEIRVRRVILYKQLLSLPGIVVQKMYEFYIECLKRQEEKYVNFDETVDEIRNF